MIKHYRAPMRKITLAEGDSPVADQVQLFRVGTFTHADYGTFDITASELKKMAENFKSNVRGIDLAIDYKHDSEDIAAGWIKDLFLSQDETELWATVDWTPNGKKVLSEKEFRYLSPEFTYDYQDNESLKTFGPTLLGAGLTNRPTIKQMEPVVELSEIKGAGDLDACAKDLIGELIKQGHPQDQAVAIAYSKCRKEMGIQSTESPQPKKATEKEVKTMDYKAMSPEELDKMSPEQMKALILEWMKKMGEMDTQMSASDAAKKVAEEKVACAEKEKALSEKKTQFAKLLSEGKACKAQEESYFSGDAAKFAELAQPVKLAEGGTAGKDETKVIASKEEAETELLKLAEEKMKEGKAKSKADAISMVLKEKKELREKIYA